MDPPESAGKRESKRSIYENPEKGESGGLEEKSFSSKAVY